MVNCASLSGRSINRNELPHPPMSRAVGTHFDTASTVHPRTRHRKKQRMQAVKKAGCVWLKRPLQRRVSVYSYLAKQHPCELQPGTWSQHRSCSREVQQPVWQPPPETGERQSHVPLGAPCGVLRTPPQVPATLRLKLGEAFASSG